MEIALEHRMMNWAGQLFLLGVAGLQKPKGVLLLGLLGLFCIRLLWLGKWEPASKAFGLQFAATLLVSVLASPHHYIYDLSVVFLSAMQHVLDTDGTSWPSSAMSVMLMTLPWALFLSLPSALIIRVQLGVLWTTVMSSLAFVQIRSTRALEASDEMQATKTMETR